jgi:hypothetical protein
VSRRRSSCRARWSSAPRGPREPPGCEAMVELRARGVLEAPGGAGERDRRPGSAPGGPGLLGGRRRLCQMGREAAPDRGRVGIRRAWGLSQQPFAWGESFRPEGKIMANTWQGRFPDQNAKEDGWERTAPVASYPPNGFGLFDMAGNVWQWCADWYRHDYYAQSPTAIPRAAGQSRPDRARGPEARPARRLVPLQRPVLFAIHARRAGEGGRRHRFFSRRISMRPLPTADAARGSLIRGDRAGPPLDGVSSRYRCGDVSGRW